MYWSLVKSGLLLVVLICSLAGCSEDSQQKNDAASLASVAGSQVTAPDGEALFRQFCAPCHPNGGNVSDPEHALYGSVLRRKHIATQEDIVRIMRNPRSRMIRFDVKTLADRDAKAIAEYVIATFK